MCVCVRACTRVYVCVWPMYTCTRVLLARSTFRVSVVSFCALSAVLGLSQPPRECERARTHIATLLCTTRHVSLSLSLFLSFAFSLSPFLSYSLVNLDLASILSGCVLFSRVRTRRSVAGQARGRGERRENAGERERGGRWTDGGKERAAGAERVDRWAPTTPKVRAPPPPTTLLLFLVPRSSSSSFLRRAVRLLVLMAHPLASSVPPWTNCRGGGATPAL